MNKVLTTINKMKIAERPDQDLPIGSLGSATFTIPEVKVSHKGSGKNAKA